MPRECIFCGNPLAGVCAKEHVIPQWLMEYLGMNEHQLYLAVAQSADDSILESRNQVASNFVAGRVCESCNNEWMSDLETESMELLKILIDGTVSLMCISNAERTIVAKWATKTAYVMSYAAPLKKTPDPSHLRYMKENRGAVPPLVGVYGCQSVATADFRQIQRNHWPHLTNSTPTVNPPAGTYKIALQFRHLMLLVAHWSGTNSELMVAAGIHIPLWPLRQVNISHHVQLFPLNINDPMAPLDRFCSTLGVCDANLVT
jgi:hypothetical protein